MQGNDIICLLVFFSFVYMILRCQSSHKMTSSYCLRNSVPHDSIISITKNFGKVVIFKAHILLQHLFKSSASEV